MVRGPHGFLDVSKLPFFDWKKAKEYERRVIESLKREEERIREIWEMIKREL